MKDRASVQETGLIIVFAILFSGSSSEEMTDYTFKLRLATPL